jgi:ABC-type antimicrobial peptide transport system, ATPase component
MQLALQQVYALPLKEKILTHTSGMWMQDIALEQGEYVFVQAPSGTGKTTLIHLLYGLRNDYEGNISWDGKQLSATDSEALAALRSKDVSVIFQDMRLFPELTALENIEVKRTLTNTVDTTTIDGWMERLGIAHKKQSLAATLSYGEQQRVAIIRALVQPYKWLLMDEPFSHLDNENIYKAAELIAEVTRQNNAGMLLADLEDNNYFNYSRKIKL